MHHRQDTGTPLQDIPGFTTTLQAFRDRPAQLHLLHGHSTCYLLGLALGSATGKPVAVIDGGMKFNSYVLAELAKIVSCSPQQLLRRTYLTRSFTAFQTEAAITTKLPPFIASTHCRSVIILDLLDTFYDDQIRPAECRESIRRILCTLRQLVARNVHVLIAGVLVEHPPPGKEHLFTLLHEAAHHVLAIHPEGHLSEERNLPWAGTMIPSH
ncbi:MAG TPA: hypothetical protein VLY03_09835 [Bacteroidota bacterium]|nr:hypothetical protein [Bacteroidota bacterium]